MKKVDSVTGLTINVPDDEPRGNFPYFGFWQEAYPQLVNQISKRNKIKASAGDINMAVNTLIGLINGPYRVILADRIYKIGETLRLNPQISVSGSGGPKISYIPDSPDGGRMDIAALTFEYAISIILDTVMNRGSVTGELSKLSNDIQTTTFQLQKYNEEFFAIQATIPSQDLLQKMNRNLSLMEKDLARLEAEYNHATNILLEATKSNEEIKEMTKLQASLKSEVVSVQNALQNKLTLLHQLENKQSLNAINQHTSNIVNTRNQTKNLGKQNQILQQKYQNISIALQKLLTSRDYANEMKELKLATNTRKKNLDHTQKEYLGLKREFDALLNERKQSVAALTDLQAVIRGLSNQLTVAQGQYEKAKAALNQVSSTREDEIVRNWSNHLLQMQREIEQRLFSNLERIAAAQRGSPLARDVEGVVLDAGTIKDYEDYLTAIDDISDALENDEIELLQMIGKLGAVQQYVLGAGRLYDLIQPGMSRRTRMESYRNMIAEILTSGSAATASYERGAININLPGLQPFSLGKEKPLHELHELVRHLSNAGLQFDYESNRGGA